MSKPPIQKELISVCLRRIEQDLGWGDSKNWTNTDFARLSEVIENRTEVLLSVTTLKRIWGKVKYDNQPTTTTLNALAKYCGFESWRSFVMEQSREQSLPKPIDVLTPTSLPAGQLSYPKELSRQKQFVRRAAVAGVILMLSAFLFFMFKEGPRKSGSSISVTNALDTSLFSFSLNKVVTTGVPNSVIFRYDASRATSDSVHIVQTWDIRRQTPVPKHKNEFSAIYYYPGYFRTKLIVDSQVVKERDLMVATDGWLCLIEQLPTPVYFSKNEFLKDSILEVSADVIQAHGIAMEPLTPKLKFFNIRNLGNLKNDNFTFTTSVKNKFRTGSGVCQSVQVLIQCENDIIIIPLSAKQCIGDLQLNFAGKEVRSKEADLSGFGCDLSEWTTLRIECKNKFARIYVNDREAYSLTFDHDATGIVGLQYRFDGTGAIKNTRFTDGKETYGF